MHTSRLHLSLLQRLCAIGGIGILGSAWFVAVWVNPAAHASHAHGCVSADANYKEMVEQFDYNRHAPLQVKDLGVTQQDGVSIHDITYVSEGKVISAYLVTPPGQGPFAGVVFMHWLDSSPTANRTEFLQEAVTLAKKGTVSLLPQGFYPWVESPLNVQHDCSYTIQQTIAIRRGLDLLLSQPSVDHKRVAFVGHDYGAMYGAILAGVEKRFKAFALMAPTERFSIWNVPFFLDTLTPRQRLDYLVDTASLDPITYIGHAAPAPVLLQFARNDRFVALGNAFNLEEVVSSPNESKQYDADHSLTDGNSQQDRIAWISTQLGLS